MAIFPNIKWWHYTENDIFYFQSSWKDGLSKNNCAGIWPFLYYLERWYFFFPKIWSYTLGRKWKMILLKTTHGNMIFSSGPLKWWSSQKGRHMIFLVVCRKMFFFRKHGIFPLAESEEWPLRGNTWKYTFSAYTYGCYKHGAMPPCQKKSISRKKTPKGDWRFRSTSQKGPLPFFALSWRYLQAYFLHCSPARKNRKLNI